MADSRAGRRAGSAGRRAGYLVAAVINCVFLYLVNVWPTWLAVPFLTESTREILPLLNASFIVAVGVNLIDFVFDRAWLKALGDLVGAIIGLLVSVRLWLVFPFDFGASAVDWVTVARIALIAAIAGSAIAIIVQLVVLVRAAVRAA
ncbi:hypothetical protein BH09ACT6_BH09ACT6_04680 [soil metagenome]